MRSLWLALLLSCGCTSRADLGDAPGRLFGVSSADGTTTAVELERLERRVGRTFALDRIYRQWANAAAGDRERETLAAGRIPVVSFNGRRAGSSNVLWADVARGEHDAHLHMVAQSYAALNAPLFVLFHQEADDDAPEFGSFAEYRAAYRRIVDTFRAEGASRVRFVFALRSPAFARADVELYPGDDVVDWVAANVYNFGSESEGSRWVSFRALISDFVHFGAGNKPLMVAECASIEDPNDPGRKAAWLDAARDALSEFPAIRALIYFHSPDSSLSIESSEPAFDAFRRLALDPVNSVTP